MLGTVAGWLSLSDHDSQYSRVSLNWLETLAAATGSSLPFKPAAADNLPLPFTPAAVTGLPLAFAPAAATGLPLEAAAAGAPFQPAAAADESPHFSIDRGRRGRAAELLLHVESMKWNMVGVPISSANK